MYLYIKDVTNEILFDFMWYYFLLWMLSSLLIKSGIKKKKRENKYARLIFGKLLSLILSIALGFVSVMAFKGNNFLSNITGSFTQTRVICMYVKKRVLLKV